MAATSSPLKNIRRQTAKRQLITGPANADSAYSRLKRKNDEIDGRGAPPPRAARRESATPPPGAIIITPAPRRHLKTHIGTFSIPHPRNSTVSKAKKKRSATTANASSAVANTDVNKGIRSDRSPPSLESQQHTTTLQQEIWRPANGLIPSQLHACKPTPTLGIARISTWRVPPFTRSLMQLLHHHGFTGELQTGELVHGGESVTDVLVVFECETVAEEVKGAVDGVVVEGRVLRVGYV